MFSFSVTDADTLTSFETIYIGFTFYTPFTPFCFNAPYQ